MSFNNQWFYDETLLHMLYVVYKSIAHKHRMLTLIQEERFSCVPIAEQEFKQSAVAFLGKLV